MDLGVLAESLGWALELTPPIHSPNNNPTLSRRVIRWQPHGGPHVHQLRGAGLLLLQGGLPHNRADQPDHSPLLSRHGPLGGGPGDYGEDQGAPLQGQPAGHQALLRGRGRGENQAGWHIVGAGLGERRVEGLLLGAGRWVGRQWGHWWGASAPRAHRHLRPHTPPLPLPPPPTSQVRHTPGWPTHRHGESSRACVRRGGRGSRNAANVAGAAPPRRARVADKGAVRAHCAPATNGAVRTGGGAGRCGSLVWLNSCARPGLLPLPPARGSWGHEWWAWGARVGLGGGQSVRRRMTSQTWAAKFMLRGGHMRVG